MKRLLRVRPFLIVASLLLVMFLIGQFWQAPFHDDEVGFTRLFGRAWDVVFLPVRFALGLSWVAGLEPSRVLAILASAGYIGIFVALDVFLAKRARRVSVDAA